MTHLLRKNQSPQSSITSSLTSFWEPLHAMERWLQWNPFVYRAANMSKNVFIPQFDVKETKDHFVLEADLPGFKEEDIDVSITGKHLTITGKREAENKQESDNYFVTERSYGQFSRSFTLPDTANVEQAQVGLKQGVLHLTLPKRPESQTKKIEFLKP